MLTAIQSTLPPPHVTVLAQLDLSGLLDAPSGLHAVNLDALNEAVSEDSDRDMHSSIYHMLIECEVDVPEWQSDGDAMLRESGHQQVVQSLELTHFDLCYNFHRYESWEKVLSKPAATSCAAYGNANGGLNVLT